jgi:hypothetical protein
MAIFAARGVHSEAQIIIFRMIHRPCRSFSDQAVPDFPSRSSVPPARGGSERRLPPRRPLPANRQRELPPVVGARPQGQKMAVAQHPELWRQRKPNKTWSFVGFGANASTNKIAVAESLDSATFRVFCVVYVRAASGPHAGPQQSSVHESLGPAGCRPRDDPARRKSDLALTRPGTAPESQRRSARTLR